VHLVAVDAGGQRQHDRPVTAFRVVAGHHDSPSTVTDGMQVQAVSADDRAPRLALASGPGRMLTAEAQRVARSATAAPAARREHGGGGGRVEQSRPGSAAALGRPENSQRTTSNFLLPPGWSFRRSQERPGARRFHRQRRDPVAAPLGLRATSNRWRSTRPARALPPIRSAPPCSR